MSFKEQERALFDLLFDQNLRNAFVNHSVSALENYDLSNNERDDFKYVRPDALELDAYMRANLILSHLCRVYPLSFSIISSLDEGIEILRSLINVEIMRTHPVDRATAYGSKLREIISQNPVKPDQEQAKIIAILEAEVGMAWTAASLKRVVLDNGEWHQAVGITDDNWSERPISLAPYVCAGIIPQPLAGMKKAICPNPDSDLWTRICKSPMTVSGRRKILGREDPRLLVTRAKVSHFSECEPTIDHYSAELSEGFATLFQYLNGTSTAADLLLQLKNAGATDEILQGVKNSFKQLLDNGMLILNI